MLVLGWAVGIGVLLLAALGGVVLLPHLPQAVRGLHDLNRARPLTLILPLALRAVGYRQTIVVGPKKEPPHKDLHIWFKDWTESDGNKHARIFDRVVHKGA